MNNERKKVWSQAFIRGVKESDDAIVSISKELNISETLAILLYNRGYRSAVEAKKFICYETANLNDPFLLNDMDLAVERIKKAVENNEKIYIYGDYDVDGVTSVSMLYLYLSSLGADVGIKIPKRDTEGYGISCESVKLMAEEGTKLIVTVDTGITAAEEIEYAAELGIDVVITDHHKCRSELPPAVAVVNPHREDSTYPFCELAGVGVAFKLICAIETRLCEMRGEPVIDGIRRVIYEYADLAAIGTIADVMPLVDENRLIVGIGLKQIMDTKRCGLAALIEAASVNKNGSETQNTKKKKITSSFIGYGIAPRINAAGRISDAMIAVRLLLCDNKEEAQKAGYKDTPASLTFPTLMNFWGYPEIWNRMTEIGIDIKKLLHAKEEYEYFSPIYPGDVITGKVKVDSMRASSAMDMVTFKSVYCRDGEEVLVAKMTIVVPKGENA